jgi:signal transduction histidine kinase
LSSISLDEQLNFLLRESLRVIDAHYGNILLLEEDQLVIRATTSKDSSSIGTKLPVSGSVSGMPILRNESVIIPDVDKEPLYHRILREDYMRSELVVRLMDDQSVLGVINVESERLNAFNALHQRFLEEVANQAAVAIKFAKTKERLMQQESINEVAMETSELMHKIANKAVPIRNASERLLEKLRGMKGVAKEDLEELEMLHNAAQDILVLKKQILSPARELDFGPIDSRTVLDKALLEAQIPQPAIQVLSDCPDSIPLVRADESALVDIIVNLLNNAVAGMRKSEKKILEISVYVESNYNMVRFDIKDTGCGISAEDWKEVWKPFKTIDTISGRPQGTGLGLYTCRKLAIRLGGEVFIVSSEVNSGSVFGLRVPIYAN